MVHLMQILCTRKTRNAGQRKEPALAKAVERLGLDLNPAKLFNILRGPSSKGVSLFEFDPETWKRHMAGGLPPIRQEENEPAKKEEQERSGQHSAINLALDVDGKGKLTFGEFCFLLNRLGLHYEVRSLWLQLTDRDFLQFRDLDPETDEMLTELRISEYASCMGERLGHKGQWLGDRETVCALLPQSRLRWQCRRALQTHAARHRPWLNERQRL
eukprot:s3317_g6.t1